MSIRVMTAVFDHSPSKGSDLLVLLALADHARDDGLCWPSVERIASMSRLTVRHTQRVLRRLERSGQLQISPGGGRSTNRYVVLVGDGAAVTPSAAGVASFAGQPTTPGARVVPEVALGTVGGGADVVPGVSPASPEPLMNRNNEPSLNLSRRQRRKSPRTLPPAVDMLLRRTPRRRRLDPFVVEAISDVVGSSFPSLLRWGRLLRVWLLRGYSPRNVEGMLSAFRNGGLAPQGPQARSGSTQAREALRRWASEEDTR